MRRGAIVDGDQAPLGLLRCQRHAGDDRAGGVKQHAFERLLGGLRPGREQQVEIVEAGVQQCETGDGGQVPCRGYPGGVADAIEKCRNACDRRSVARNQVSRHIPDETGYDQSAENDACQRGRLAAGPVLQVATIVLRAAEDRWHAVADVAPHAGQDGARAALEQVTGEDLVAHHGDAVDQLLGADPGEFRCLHRAIKSTRHGVETGALGGDSRAFRRLAGGWRRT